MHAKHALPLDHPSLAYVDHFLSQREGEGCKPNTLDGYEYAILTFIIEAGVRRIDDLTVKHAIEWARILKARGLKSGAINSLQRPVWNWLRWLYNQDFIPVDIAAKVKKVRPKDVTRRTATDEIKEALIAELGRHAEMAARNIAIVELLWSSGLRRDELSRLTMGDYDRTNGTLDVMGKADIRRTIVVSASARAALWDYFHKEQQKRKEREQRGRTVPPRPLDLKAAPLFADRKGEPMSSQAIRLMISGAAQAAGVTVSAHDFRRACAANMLAAGVGFDSVMYQLGHSTPTMTMTYGALGRKTRAHAEIRKMDAARMGKRGSA